MQTERYTMIYQNSVSCCSRGCLLQDTAWVGVLRIHNEVTVGPAQQGHCPPAQNGHRPAIYNTTADLHGPPDVQR